MLGDQVFQHLYKEFLIFMKTLDDSLVQISGTNIFVYLNEKLGKLQQAFYEDRRKKEKEDKEANPVEKIDVGQDGPLGFQAEGAEGE